MRNNNPTDHPWWILGLVITLVSGLIGILADGPAAVHTLEVLWRFLGL